jgi:hypothetical protein
VGRKLFLRWRLVLDWYPGKAGMGMAGAAVSPVLVSLPGVAAARPLIEDRYMTGAPGHGDDITAGFI